MTAVLKYWFDGLAEENILLEVSDERLYSVRFENEKLVNGYSPREPMSLATYASYKEANQHFKSKVQSRKDLYAFRLQQQAVALGTTREELTSWLKTI